MMTTLYIVRASHPAVPGEPTSIHFTSDAANAKALELVEAMFTDRLVIETPITSDMLRADGEPPFVPGNWRDYLRQLQVARIVEQSGGDEMPEGVEAEADEHGDAEAWLADQAELDVWIETLDADMPLPRVLVECDNGRVHRITVDTVPVDLLSLDDGTAISCPAMCAHEADRIDPKIADAFARYWQPIAPTVN